MFQDFKNIIPGKQNNNDISDMIVDSSLTRMMFYIADFLVLAIPRLISMLIIGHLSEKSKIELIKKIDLQYGGLSNISSKNKEHVILFLNSDYARYIFLTFAVLIIIGIIYQVLMLTSSWGATIGQRLTGVMVVKNKSEDLRLDFFDALNRSIIAQVIWVFAVFVVGFWRSHFLISVISLIIIAFWYDLSGLTGRKISVYDLLTKTSLIYGKSKVKKLTLFYS